VQRCGKHASTTELLLGKHVPEATVTHATGETRCSTRSGPRSCKEKRPGATSQFGSASEAEKRWRYSWQLAVVS
jgi:hypothetical protein